MWVDKYVFLVSEPHCSRENKGQTLLELYYIQVTVLGAESKCHSSTPKAWDPISPDGSVSVLYLEKTLIGIAEASLIEHTF